MKDEHGQPINQTELEKDRHNKDWVRAIQTGDVELKNRVLMEQFRYVESLRVPSPREIRERGIEFYFEKDPALFTGSRRSTASTTASANGLHKGKKEQQDGFERSCPFCFYYTNIRAVA